MAGKTVRIGGYSAMWGDVDLPATQLVHQGKCHYLMGDYLAETTMAILAKQRKADPKMGFASAIVAMLKKHGKEIKRQGLKVVCNAGGMNPLGCRDAIMAVCAQMKVDLKVGCVLGDEITDTIPDLRQQGVKEMFTSEPIPDQQFTSANAYFGAKPIAAALAKGVDIVVTGRVVDSALALGILMHEFGWKDDQYDELCMGTLVGHLLECSAQSTGGLFTDFEAMKWDNMGYPVCEVSKDGSFTLSKPDNTDGLVSFGTVAEQLIYEIQDPGAYHCPDVACDFTPVKIEEIGKDVVRVSGGKGSPPTDSYKVCCTIPDNFANISVTLIVGADAAAKARKTHETIMGRTRKIMNEMKMEDFIETRVEILGGAHFDPNKDEKDATEVILKVGLKHKDKRAFGIYSKEGVCAGVSMAQGTTGWGGTGVSGKVSEVLRVFSLLLPKTAVVPQVVVGNERFSCPVPTHGGFKASGSESVKPVPAKAPEGELESVPLIKLCYARSGDKGNCANIGLIARKPEFLPLLRHTVTAERVKKYFSHRVKGDVARFDLPGIGAMNFLCQDALGGGGMATLHSDPLAKTFGQVLLLMRVDVPKAWGLGGGSPSKL